MCTVINNNNNCNFNKMTLTVLLISIIKLDVFFPMKLNIKSYLEIFGKEG